MFYFWLVYFAVTLINWENVDVIVAWVCSAGSLSLFWKCAPGKSPISTRAGKTYLRLHVNREVKSEETKKKRTKTTEVMLMLANAKDPPCSQRVISLCRAVGSHTGWHLVTMNELSHSCLHCPAALSQAWFLAQWTWTLITVIRCETRSSTTLKRSRSATGAKSTCCSFPVQEIKQFICSVDPNYKTDSLSALIT